MNHELQFACAFRHIGWAGLGSHPFRLHSQVVVNGKGLKHIVVGVLHLDIHFRITSGQACAGIFPWRSHHGRSLQFAIALVDFVGIGFVEQNGLFEHAQSVRGCPVLVAVFVSFDGPSAAAVRHGPAVEGAVASAIS